MIRVAQAAEPASFNDQVRTPGLAFLATNPTPKSKEFKPYWRAILQDIRDAYNSICAYSCHFVSFDTGADTVEHFRPKVPYPADAYEWSNYRFVCSRLNGRKGNFEDVIDPFHVENGWFELDFPSLQVKPGSGVHAATRTRVLDTIKRLKLNDEATCIRQRSQYVDRFLALGMDYFNVVIQRDAPFLAAEIVRQNLLDNLRVVMSLEA
jgi:uncharacterized protein (TIGR02646 family)